MSCFSVVQAVVTNISLPLTLHVKRRSTSFRVRLSTASVDAFLISQLTGASTLIRKSLSDLLSILMSSLLSRAMVVAFRSGSSSNFTLIVFCNSDAASFNSSIPDSKGADCFLTGTNFFSPIFDFFVYGGFVVDHQCVIREKNRPHHWHRYQAKIRAQFFASDMNALNSLS